MDEELKQVILDSARQAVKENIFLRRLVGKLLAVVILCVIIIVGGFVYYETQFESVTTTTETSDIQLQTEGDSANAQYIEGSQYNDNAVHTENGK